MLITMQVQSQHAMISIIETCKPWFTIRVIYVIFP